ncbi:carbohydrate ABC transporter permease [Cohnella sp. REN36]|uniref:carbohydrate ABC transporter permease n=1 Tax=Cohnella sp. REN36 TaxID=2887347 RepID=UPI001D145FF6|nr:sugar ABC transporter permease [Cohnella sp. REN36]MCC3375445.1 sugar ABC transporter permease [Cohnella sp. REN36]
MSEGGKSGFRNKSKVQRNIFIVVMLAWPLLYFAVFGIYLQIQTVLFSFQRWNYVSGKQVWVGLDNYRQAMKELIGGSYWRTGMTNALLFIPVNYVLITLSILVAVILSRKFPFASFYRIVYFFPTILSIVVLTMVYQFSLHPTNGIVNGLLGFLGLEDWQRSWLGERQTAFPAVIVYCLWAGIGFYNVMFTGALQRIPIEYYEVGKLEGITFWKELFSVVLPAIWPTISTFIILGTSGAFLVYLQPLLLTNGGPNHSSTTAALEMFQAVLGAGNYGMAATFGIIFAVIGSLVTFLVKRAVDRVDTADY